MSVVGYDFLKPLHEAGLVPDYTKRVVIDIPVNDCVKVYYETFASKEILDVTIESLIKHKDKIKVVPIKEIQQE